MCDSNAYVCYYNPENLNAYPRFEAPEPNFFQELMIISIISSVVICLLNPCAYHLTEEEWWIQCCVLKFKRKKIVFCCGLSCEQDAENENLELNSGSKNLLP